MPSPESGSTRPAASPTSRTRPRAAGAPSSRIGSRCPRTSVSAAGSTPCARASAFQVIAQARPFLSSTRRRRGWRGRPSGTPSRSRRARRRARPRRHSRTARAAEPAPGHVPLERDPPRRSRRRVRRLAPRRRSRRPRRRDTRRARAHLRRGRRRPPRRARAPRRAVPSLKSAPAAAACSARCASSLRLCVIAISGADVVRSTVVRYDARMHHPVDDSLDHRLDVARQVAQRPARQAAAARLVAGKARLVDQHDTGAAAREMHRRRRSGRAGSDHQHVDSLHAAILESPRGACRRPRRGRRPGRVRDGDPSRTRRRPGPARRQGALSRATSRAAAGSRGGRCVTCRATSHPSSSTSSTGWCCALRYGRGRPARREPLILMTQRRAARRAPRRARRGRRRRLPRGASRSRTSSSTTDVVGAVGARACAPTYARRRRRRERRRRARGRARRRNHARRRAGGQRAVGGARPRALRATALIELGVVPGGYGWVFPKGDHANLGVGGWWQRGAAAARAPRGLARAHGVDPARSPT